MSRELDVVTLTGAEYDALVDERERREAAEKLLRSGYTTAELVAHFARYGVIYSYKD